MAAHEAYGVGLEVGLPCFASTRIDPPQLSR
jgi:hypothetical protein